MLPEWLLPYLPAITALLGALLSWALASDSPLVGWFRALSGWGKVGSLVGLAVLYGALVHFGFDQELVEGVMQALLLLLGSQVGYQLLPSKG